MLMSDIFVSYICIFIYRGRLWFDYIYTYSMFIVRVSIKLGDVLFAAYRRKFADANHVKNYDTCEWRTLAYIFFIVFHESDNVSRLRWCV